MNNRIREIGRGNMEIIAKHIAKKFNFNINTVDYRDKARNIKLTV